MVDRGTILKPKTLKPLSKKEVREDMNKLRELYGIPKDMKGDIEQCRRIISKCGSLSDELQKMRDEERNS